MACTSSEEEEEETYFGVQVHFTGSLVSVLLTSNADSGYK